ncbi:MAG: peptide-methionine (S)-S-oxide reductase MsrA [Glycocaulis sp.]
MRLIASLAALILVACSEAPAGSAQQAGERALPDGAERAVFAAGCFWCGDSDFARLEGVIETVSGYTGGHVDYPEYRQVVNGNTGHVEAVEVIYDPTAISYDQLLHFYWRNVDPFDGRGQFCDRGPVYAPFIFTGNDSEREAAERSAREVEARFGRAVAVGIRDAERFWPAEEYHQNYASENPAAYQRYRLGCRRDERLRQIWGEEAGG